MRATELLIWLPASDEGCPEAAWWFVQEILDSRDLQALQALRWNDLIHELVESFLAVH
jgi:hypothetical protein